MLYRRATVGSDVLKDATPDAAPSSVTRYSRNINERIKWLFGPYRPIDSSNKGRQMLEKLGWSSGQGLGRSNTGIIEPVRAKRIAPHIHQLMHAINTY